MEGHWAYSSSDAERQWRCVVEAVASCMMPDSSTTTALPLTEIRRIHRILITGAYPAVDRLRISS